VGIGLFITFIGVYDAGFVRIPASLATPTELGMGGSLDAWPLFVFAFGVLLAAVLMVRKVRGGILIAIVASTVLAVVIEAVAQIGKRTDDNPGGWSLNVPALPDKVVALPDFSLIGQFSLFGSFEKIGALAVILLVFTLLIADFFDTMGTMVAIGGEAGLLDEKGNPPRTTQILIVDSIAASAGGMGSVSSNTAYVESASGVGDGARTGLAAVTTGVAFLLTTFLAPLVTVVPHEAATPALVIVGFLMVVQVTGIDWKNLEVAIPAFLTMVLMPFAYSITVGIGAGVISYVLLKVVVGKARKVHPLLWIAAALFVVYFLLGPIRSAVGI
jgi:AGZA family xanthine/uracil permease-like MFS transporter